MAMLKAGTRLKSAVCSTEMMVVLAPETEVTLRCGGVPVIEMEADPPQGATLDPEYKSGTQMGKRYVSEDGTLEVLCTKPGEGSLAIDGSPLTIKGAKPLPSSD